jgi:hypothetical protein
MRVAVLVPLFCVLGCANGANPPARRAAGAPATPADEQHKGVTGPHGDHTPHHGGLVLMNGDIHYEVVFGADGRHQVWFSDATRNELPASVVSGVRMEVARPGAPVEPIDLAIDEAGEAWVATGRPLASDGIMVAVRYALDGKPYEIEVPYAPQTR